MAYRLEYHHLPVKNLTESNDIANILQRTGFNLVTVDVEQYTIQYPSMFELFQDLRLMGENTALENSARNLNKQTILAAASIYNRMNYNFRGPWKR
jgi:NADH dehydrogenase [ubiquinone] 1 alpha subcomplex assembly factor 5